MYLIGHYVFLIDWEPPLLFPVAALLTECWSTCTKSMEGIGSEGTWSFAGGLAERVEDKVLHAAFIFFWRHHGSLVFPGL